MMKKRLFSIVIFLLFFLMALLNIMVVFDFASDPPGDYSWTLDPSNKWHCENGWYEHCTPKSAYSW